MVSGFRPLTEYRSQHASNDRRSRWKICAARRRKVIHRSLVYLALSFMAAGIVLGGANILTREWKAGYTTLFMPWNHINWFSYLYDTSLDRLIRPFRSSDEAGLQTVRLYIPGIAQNSLTSDMPYSTKNWQEAKLLYPDGNVHRVRVRHRGDNPINWFFEKNMRSSLKRHVSKSSVSVWPCTNTYGVGFRFF